jgi:hypothetical protein
MRCSQVGGIAPVLRQRRAPPPDANCWGAAIPGARRRPAPVGSSAVSAVGDDAEQSRARGPSSRRRTTSSWVMDRTLHDAGGAARTTAVPTNLI